MKKWRKNDPKKDPKNRPKLTISESLGAKRLRNGPGSSVCQSQGDLPQAAISEGDAYYSPYPAVRYQVPTPKDGARKEASLRCRLLERQTREGWDL